MTSLTYSQEDVKFMKKMKDGIHKGDDGHYELPLPLRDENLKLPPNRDLAEKRLYQLKKRFDRDLKYKKDYTRFMNDMINSGYAEEAPNDCESAWYIPHHGVYHPKKPEKIRVVFNCSAGSQEQSLNQHLLQGPDLTNSLVGVLCRFRQEPVAFCCDIEGMFHQVRVNPNRDYLRFLWWKEGNTSIPPTEYRMKVHLFGATSSPGCANFALRTAADDGEDKMGTEAAVFIRENFYVDDGLKSVSTVSDAVEIIQKGTEMCKQAGFRLHKFSSNSKDVLQAIPPDERSKEVKEIDIKNDMLSPERVLGVEWNVENDAFQFRIQLKDKPLTRRGILSTVSSIYDPLGFAAPFLLRGKKILQFLCKDNLGWDDPIPNVLRSQWERWRGELHLLESLEVPRCFKPEGMQEPKKVELHHFSDASTEGYGQCTYLRLVDNNNLVNCSLVMGKARVTPLKPVTVPRLELTAALVSVRVSSMLSRELRYNGVEEIFWTDSKVVQSYINNDARRFHTYVANRVQQIRDHTKPTQWKYVESEHNPADDASRGLSPKNLTRSSRWIRGPDFLWEHHDSWKDFGDDTPEALSSDDKEVKESSALFTTAKAKERLASILQRLQYFSDWFRAKRAIANCIRYIKILQVRVQRRKSRETDCSKVTEGTLTVEELKQAEQMIVKLTQSEAFGEELTILKGRRSHAKEEPSERGRGQTNTLPRTSPLYRLDPFVDNQGLLRVGGRIREASIAYEVKHPLILPRVGHVSHLIARNFHETTKHQGRGFTVNEVR